MAGEGGAKQDRSIRTSIAEAQARRPRQTASPEVQEAFFKALADKTRLQILGTLLDHGALNVSEICQRLQREPSAVSHHLACLRACGLVSAEREGKFVTYALNGDSRVERILRLCAEQIAEAQATIQACEVVGSSGNGKRNAST